MMQQKSKILQSFLCMIMCVLLGSMLSACNVRSQKQFRLVVEQRTQEAYQIYTVKPDGTELEQHVDFPRGHLYWLAPNSKLLAYYTRSQKVLDDPPERSLAIIDTISGDTIRVIEQVGNTITEHLPHYEEVIWSPNSDRLIFVKDSAGGQGMDLWVYDVNLDTTTPLTQDEAWDWSPAWSPDGTQIAFVTLPACGQRVFDCPFDEFYWDVEVIDADGSNRRTVVDFPEVGLLPSYNSLGAWLDSLLCDFSWSSDGNYITFRDKCGWLPGFRYGGLAFVAAVDGSSVINIAELVDMYESESALLSETITGFAPHWLSGNNALFVGYTRWEISPDRATFRGQLVIDLADFSHKSIDNGATGLGSFTVWSPDGHYVIGSSNAGLSATIEEGLTMTFGEWDERQDVIKPISRELPNGYYNGRDILWSPDGRYFAYGMVATDDGIQRIAIVSVDEGNGVSVVEFMVGEIRPIGWIVDE